MQNRICRTILIILVAFSCTAALAAQQLIIREGTRQTTLAAGIFEGNSYYRVAELAEVLGLKVKETGSNLDIIGDRGGLTVIQNRPLVRSGSQYILLSAPVIKMRSTGWWVPEDFLEKLLPNILSRQLVSSGGNVYRIGSLNENVVRVQTVDYPDHVSVVFRASEQVSTRIREFNDFIEIRFEQYVVDLEEIENPDSIDVVSSISFDPTDGLGTFRISKGRSFGRYRDYVLTNPPRVVIDFYEDPRARKAAESSPEVDGERPYEVFLAEDPREVPGITGNKELEEDVDVVVIDPGHGGVDAGVESGSGLMEKNLALAIAGLLENKLQERGIKTRITRNRDVYLTPDQRSSVANLYSTRAFISLHLGGSPSAATQGPVVYVSRPYSEKRDMLNAESENGEKGSEGPLKAPGEDNPDRSLMIPWDEVQKPWAEKSVLLARSLQDSLNTVFLSNNRIMEVPISVLESVQSPAVMIEIGFLTNALDREFLLSAGYQDEMARLIADGIMKFLR